MAEGMKRKRVGEEDDIVLEEQSEPKKPRHPLMTQEERDMRKVPCQRCGLSITLREKKDNELPCAHALCYGCYAYSDIVCATDELVCVLCHLKYPDGDPDMIESPIGKILGRNMDFEGIADELPHRLFCHKCNRNQIRTCFMPCGHTACIGCTRDIYWATANYKGEFDCYACHRNVDKIIILRTADELVANNDAESETDTME